MNHKIWAGYITRSWCPAWTCPTCRQGVAKLDPKSLIYTETARSRGRHSEEGFDPLDIEFSFIAQAKCNNDTCREIFSMSGLGGNDIEYDEHGSMDIEPFFRPRMILPMPAIIDIPKRCPKPVRDALSAAFELFPASEAACANRLRIALERLMTHLGIPELEKKGSGTRRLSLHDRIERYANLEPDVGPQLRALKVLGNTGSHEIEVTRDDLMVAFEILEHALSEILDQRSKKIQELTKSLLDKHST